MLLFTCRSSAAAKNNSSTENTSAAVVRWHNSDLLSVIFMIFSHALHSNKKVFIGVKILLLKVNRIFASLIMIEIPKKTDYR